MADKDVKGKKPEVATAPKAGEGLWTSGERTLKLVKQNGECGFSVVAGPAFRNRVYVSKIGVDGVAAKDGRLKVGDRVLKVNDTDMDGFAPEKVSEFLVKLPDVMHMFVERTPDEYANFRRSQKRLERAQIEARALDEAISTHKPFHVRANFTYDNMLEGFNPPAGSAVIDFKVGDVMHVVSSANRDWWDAEFKGKKGRIPSASLAIKTLATYLNEPEEKKEKEPAAEEKKKGAIGSLFKKKKPQEAPKDENLAYDVLADKLVHTYSVVTQSTLRTHGRLVLLSGPLKRAMVEYLLSTMPEKYKGIPPHTSRDKREGEENGREYFFTTRETIEGGDFIERLELNGQIYGVSV
eukprot:Colp12_sorted_trinity150504_noHs@12129